MAVSDCEIEYLDEDAEIVQQCFQTTLAVEPDLSDYTFTAEEKIIPLLVERPVSKRRKKKDDDSDYDPNEDYTPPSPPSPKAKKRRTYTNMYKKVHKLQPQVQNKPHSNVAQATVSNFRNLKKIVKENKVLSAKEQFAIRKKLNIRIPDYDDPLCLPVKAVKRENSDMKRLGVWNNVCLEHFKHCDTLLRPERGETKSSTRAVVLRNVVNKQLGKLETTIWSKTTVESDEGEKKSEIFQCVLPKYNEMKVLKSYSMSLKRPKPFRAVDEVLLTKEEHKEGEALVVYKPKECVSSVYMLFNKKSNSDEELLESTINKEDDDSKMYMKEMACCKICALCFQSSWRGVKKHEKKSIVCPVCARTYGTVSSLLTHLKSHPSSEVQRYKRVISSGLSEVVEYHYKCRLCSSKFDCIKKLRDHVRTHQGKEQFICEVGNHLAL